MCQRLAWKAGHKRECVPATPLVQEHIQKALQQATCPSAAEQIRLFEKMHTLYEASDWEGVVKLEGEAVAMARALRDVKPYIAAQIYATLGASLQHLGLARATMMHQEQKAAAEDAGDRIEVALACVNLGGCFQSNRQYKQGIKILQQAKVIAAEEGDKRLAAQVACNLGNCLESLGLHECAVKMHQEQKTLWEGLGDQAQVGAAVNNLGLCYQHMGNYDGAIAMHLQSQKILKAESGSRAALGLSYGNLAECYLCVGNYEQAILCYKDQWAVATGLKLGQMQARTALGLGVALRLQVRADGQDSPGASLGIGDAVEIHSLKNASELNGAQGEIYQSKDPESGRWAVRTATGRIVALKTVNLQRVHARVPEARKWLNIALASGEGLARLHLSHLAFDAAQEEEACTLLGTYLSWRVKLSRDMCAGCELRRADDAPMLACSGCNVARFCSADCQKMASKRALSGKSVLWERHKDICGLIGKWRHVSKSHVIKRDTPTPTPPASLAADLLDFLARCRRFEMPSEGPGSRSLSGACCTPGRLHSALARVGPRQRHVIVYYFSFLCFSLLYFSCFSFSP